MDDELMLAPGFAAPPSLDYSGYHQYRRDASSREAQCCMASTQIRKSNFWSGHQLEVLAGTLLEMQPRNAVSSEELGQCTEDKVAGRCFFSVEGHRTYTDARNPSAQPRDFPSVYTQSPLPPALRDASLVAQLVEDLHQCRRPYFDS